MKNPEKPLFDFSAHLAEIREGKSILKFKKNDIIFSQGDLAGSIFYIQKGTVKLSVVSEQGKEAVVAIMEPGQFFGEGCLNGGYGARRYVDFAGRQHHRFDNKTGYAHGAAETAICRAFLEICIKSQ